MARTKRNKTYKHYCPKSCEYCRSNRTITNQKLKIKAKEMEKD